MARRSGLSRLNFSVNLIGHNGLSHLLPIVHPLVPNTWSEAQPEYPTIQFHLRASFRKLSYATNSVVAPI